MSARIVTSPEVRGGKPRIEGSRITVSDVAYWMRQGLDAEGIVGVYPHLEIEEVQAAMGYYEGHRQEIDRRQAEDDALAEEMRRTHPQTTSTPQAPDGAGEGESGS